MAAEAKRRYVDRTTRYEGVHERHSLNCDLAIGGGRCTCRPTYYGTVWDSEIGRNRRTPRSDTVAEARNRRADLLAEVELRRGRRGARRSHFSVADGHSSTARIRFADAHDEFIAACRHGIALNKLGRPYTRKATSDLDHSLGRLPQWLRRKYLDEIQDSDFQQVVDDLRAKGLSSSRISSIINAARSLSRWAHRRGKVTTPLAGAVDLPANDSKPRDRIASPGEFAHLLTYLQPEDAIPWALAGYGTARAQEIEAHEWPEVDFEHDVNLFGAQEDAQKSEAARRIVPMVRQLRERLYAEWLRQGSPKTGLVCPPRQSGSRSGRLSLNSLQKRRFPTWKKIGLKPIGLQDSRHTAATWLDHAGVSPKVASVFMGHKAPGRQPDAAPITLRRYTHVLPGELERARDQLQSFLDEREAEEADRVFLETDSH
jgi:integrase